MFTSRTNASCITIFIVVLTRIVIWTPKDHIYIEGEKIILDHGTRKESNRLRVT